MKIYIGNLSANVNKKDLEQAFGAFGKVDSVDLETDKITGANIGSGSVEMPSIDEGDAAIESLNGVVLKEQKVVVQKNPLLKQNRSSRRKSKKAGKGGFNKGSEGGGYSGPMGGFSGQKGSTRGSNRGR